MQYIKPNLEKLSLSQSKWNNIFSDLYDELIKPIRAFVGELLSPILLAVSALLLIIMVVIVLVKKNHGEDISGKIIVILSILGALAVSSFGLGFFNLFV